MIVYFDTSALVPLLVAEPTTAACTRLWEDADDAVTCRVTYVEAAAALAQANRLGRLTAFQHDAAVRGLAAIWSQFTLVEVDQRLMHTAAEFAALHALRAMMQSTAPQRDWLPTTRPSLSAGTAPS